MPKTKRQSEIAYEHLTTGIKIKTSNICSSCPYRVYAADDENVTFGAGNIHSNFIFVLPTYDVKSKLGYSNLLSLLVDSYKEVIGRSIFEDVYVTRLVKCNKSIAHTIYYSAVSPCSHYLIYELNKLKAKNVVFFGSAYDDYMQNSDTVGGYIPFKIIHKVYSPAILFYDNPNIKAKLFNDIEAILSYN